MENKTTHQVHEELVTREGVTEIVIGPYETFQIVQDQRVHDFTGPARVLISKEVKQLDDEIYVRIKLSSVRFSDPYEQQKLERMKIESVEKVISQIESLFEHQTITISFD